MIKSHAILICELFDRTFFFNLIDLFKNLESKSLDKHQIDKKLVNCY